MKISARIPVVVFLAVLAVLHPEQGKAQANPMPLCALASPAYNPKTDMPPTLFAQQQMSRVHHYLCTKFSCPEYVLFQNPIAGNAMAMSNGNGYVIRYNPNFMNNVINAFGSLATGGVFAHELGHLIDFFENYTLNPQNYWQAPEARREREVTADMYAGCAFALAGNSIQDMQPLADTLHAMGPSPGYPTPVERVQLLVLGYKECHKQTPN